MDRQLRWSLAISNPEWAFTNDFSLSINLDLDGRPFRGRALVRENSSLQIEMEDQIALFATLRMAAKVRATAGGLTIELDLANSSEALSAVAQCALKQVGLGARGAILRQGSPPASRLRVMPGAKKPLVLRVQSRNVRALGAFAYWRAPKACRDRLRRWAGKRVGWRWRDDLAGERCRRVIDVRNQVIGSKAAQVSRRYFFVTTARPSAGRGRTGIRGLRCPGDGDHLHTAVPRSKGGAYVATSASEQGFVLILQRETETADARLRGAVVEALRRSDQQTPDIREKSAADGETTRPER
jgi:hypothetical protein